MKKNQNGFGVVEVILIVLVVAILVGLSWKAYGHISSKDNSNIKNTPVKSVENSAKTNKSPISNDPYDGWLTYKSMYSTATIRYPSNWTLQFTKDDDSKFENALLISPKNADSLAFAIGILVNEPTLPSTDQILKSYGSIADRNKFIVFYSDDAESTPSGFTISKYDVPLGQASANFLYHQYRSNDSTVGISGQLSNRENASNPQFGHSVSDYKNEAYWNEVIRILESFTSEL